MQQEIREIRARLKKKRKGWRWGDKLGKDVVLISERLYQKHNKWQVVADKLGIKNSTLSGIRKSYHKTLLQEKEPAEDFAIAVIPQPKVLPKKIEASNISVTSPNGFKMDGLSFEQALEAMEVLACLK